MMQEEYEKMVGHEVSAEGYALIEFVYMNHPMFSRPNDVRKFVAEDGGEARLVAMANLVGKAWSDREECLASERRALKSAEDAKAEARAALQHREDDERTIVELTRQARAAEGAAREAEELRRKAQAEADELRAKLRAIQDALCGLVFPEEVA